MGALTIRNLPEDVHRALRTRAARNGRSTEAEALAILEGVIKPDARVRIGEALWALGRRQGLIAEDIEALDRAGRPIG